MEEGVFFAGFDYIFNGYYMKILCILSLRNGPAQRMVA